MTPAQLQAFSNGFQRRTNYEAWLHGLYTHIAFSVALAAAFSPKGKTPPKYPARPDTGLEPPTEHGEDQTDRQAEVEILKAKLYMQNLYWEGRNWGK